MEHFSHKTLVTTPNNLIYSYYLSPSFHTHLQSPSPSPVLMLVHGFPDDAYMWAGAIPHLQSHFPTTPILIPDLLGFGHSDKPTETASYNYRLQASALAQILDHEGVPETKSVIPVGHDWGSATCQRFYLYYPGRCVGLGLISLAYQVPSAEVFDLDGENEKTKKKFGYPQWEYWNFFCGKDAPREMSENLMRFWEVNHGFYPSEGVTEEKGRDVWMREMFCTRGAMGEYVNGTGRYEGFTVELKPYAEDKVLQRRWVERMKRDGFAGPVNYYHSLKDNTMLEDERLLCEKDGEGRDKRVIRVPVLYIGQTGDWVCRTDLMKEPSEKGLVPDLEERVVDGGHWILYEKPVEIATVLTEWLGRRFAGVIGTS